MMICGNGHPAESDAQRFCTICGSPVVQSSAASDAPVAPGAPGSRSRSRVIIGGSIALVLIMVVTAAVVVLGRSGSSGPVTADLVGFVTSGSKQDLYLLLPGEKPDPARRLAADVSPLPILPLEGRYLESADGPVATGPTVVRLGSRTAVAWSTGGQSTQTGTIALVDAKGNSTSVFSESAPVSGSGPMEIWYSAKADALLVDLFGQRSRCYRVDADGTVTLLVRAGSCEFLPSGMVYAVTPGSSNSYQSPASNTHEVKLVDLDGSEVSTTMITGASEVRPNPTGERTIVTVAGSPETLRIHDTRSGGLLVETTGVVDASVLATSRSSNVLAYSVDNGEEALRMFVVRADASTIDLGSSERGKVQISDDGVHALVATADRLGPSDTSGSQSEVTVERLDVATGGSEEIATGLDLRPSFLGSGSDQRIVVWSPSQPSVWSGSPGGEVRRSILSVSDIRSVDLMLDTGGLLIESGTSSDRSLMMLDPQGVEKTLVRVGGKTIYPATASSDGRTVVIVVSGDGSSTLMLWRDGNTTEIDRAPSISGIALSSRGVRYTVQSQARVVSSSEVREYSFSGPKEARTIWPGAILVSSPTFSRPFEEQVFGGTTLRRAEIDQVASGCRSRGESVLRPGGSTIGNVGSTKVCIVVSDPSAIATITVVSGTDTTMGVFDSSGTRVAYDDDSGDSLNPLLRRSFAKGTYVVEIRSYRSGELGTYLLTYR